MNIFIFTEALSSTGIGHFGRCTALAEILSEKKLDVTIVLHQDDLELNLYSSNIKLVSFNWKNEDLLNSFLIKSRMGIAYIDSYLAEYHIYELVKKYSSKLVCIDDYNRIIYPFGSIILNPGFGGKFLDYDLDRNHVYTGLEYTLLRKPFRESFEFPKVNEKVQSILVTMGGTDSLNLVPKVLEFLTKDFPNVRKEVVIGPAFDNIQLIQKLADKNTNLHQGLDAISMRNLMLSVDLAITAGGQTTYELARCGTPMVIIETIENQEGNIAGFLEFGIDSIIRSEDLPKLETLLSEYLTSLADFRKRLELRILLTKFKELETDFLFGASI